MKIKLLAFLPVFILFTSCKKDDAGASAVAITVSAVNNTVPAGSWRVTYFLDNNIDKTVVFAGYNFNFAANGMLVAVKGSGTATGTWNAGTDDSQTKLFLNFSAPVEFTELSNDWHITVLTATKIQMEDISGGGGHTDLLTFEKN